MGGIHVFMLSSSSLPANSQDGDAVLALKPQNFVFTRIFLWEYSKALFIRIIFLTNFQFLHFKHCINLIEQMLCLWLSVWLTELQND